MPNEVHPVLNRYRDGELEPRDQRAAQRRGCDLAGVDRGVARQQTHWEAGDDATQQHHCHVDGLSKTWGGHVTLPPWFGPSVQIFRYQPSDRNEKDSRGSQTVRSTSFGNIQTKLLVDLNICGNSGVTVMHCHMFCQLGNLHSCIKKWLSNRDIGQNMVHILPFSSHLRVFDPFFQPSDPSDPSAEALKPAVQPLGRRRGLRRSRRPSGPASRRSNPWPVKRPPLRHPLRRSWWSNCPGSGCLLHVGRKVFWTVFFGSEKFMASFFEKWERLARGTLGL